MKERFETFKILIARLSRSVKRIKAEQMADFQLKGPHVSCLYYLSMQDGLTSAELCERADEDKAAISRSLDYLEKNGYIVRTPMENDARLKRIELTQKALDHENRVRENIMVIEEAMHEGFSKEEFNMMLGFLDRVIDNMEKLNN